MKRHSNLTNHFRNVKRSCYEIVEEPLRMLSKPYHRISTTKLRKLAASTPTISIKWLPSVNTRPEDARTLIEKLPVQLAQAFSKYGCENVKAFTDSANNDAIDYHLTEPLLLREGNGSAYRLIFESIVGHAADFDLLDDYQFDIAPLHQCHRLLKAADYLGVHRIRPSIWKKIEEIKKEPFRYSETIPILLVHPADSSPYRYVVEGVCDLIMSGWLAKDEKNLMVIRTHHPLIAVELDEALEKKRIPAALPNELMVYGYA